MENNCPICIEKYNKSKRKKIICNFCDYIACRSCYESYILQQVEPKCMNCFKNFSREYLTAFFTKVWINTDYKKHRENQLFNLEKAMLPATQPIVEKLIEDDRTRQTLQELRELLSRTRFEIRVNENKLFEKSTAPEKRIFIKKCPNQNCRGFLSTQWKCNLCGIKTCKECNECIEREGEHESEHKCDPLTVETNKLICSDSKPCPSCGEMIFKIDGCDQMYCTLCHTAFNWKTGRIETGAIHNPHYFEWLRVTNQVIPDNIEIEIRCGREIDHHFVRFGRINNMCDESLKLCRNLLHFRQIEVPRFRPDHFLDNQDLRIKYLRNNINENEFKCALQIREKIFQKKTDIYNLFGMLVQCITEILYRYCDDCKTHRLQADYSKYFDEFLNLLQYVNICLDKISKTYDSKKIMVNENLQLIDKLKI